MGMPTMSMPMPTMGMPTMDVPTMGMPTMGMPTMGLPTMTTSMLYRSAAAVPTVKAANQSLYSSMMNLPTSSLYSSAYAGPSIYASAGGLPNFSMPPMPSTSKEGKPEIPRLTEGASTVGLMLWPGKAGELIITGIKEETSASETELQVGDVIISVDGDSVEGMDATDV